MSTETSGQPMQCSLCHFVVAPGTTMRFDMKTQTYTCADTKECEHRQSHQKQA